MRALEEGLLWPRPDQVESEADIKALSPVRASGDLALECRWCDPLTYL